DRKDHKLLADYIEAIVYKGKTVYLKRFTKPIQKVQQIYHVLGLEDRAFWQKKSVFTKMEKSNSQPPDTA
ncbi:MAG TPA: hypothetical protein PK444_10635, partial [Syntrophorhabdaceae bacterium]|nr:hypothetical protein [Syntrophorhabdaceae bacterium]